MTHDTSKFTQGPIHAIAKDAHQTALVAMPKEAPLAAKQGTFAQKVMNWAKDFVGTRWKRYEDRLAVHRMLQLSNDTLDDIGVSRADIMFVLQTSSHLPATERLRLIACQNRRLERADYRRRSSHLKTLLPRLINQSKTDKLTPAE